MLRTGKQVWEAQAKRSALGIRQEELEFHIQRYTVLITQSAILTGFSFESIVHLEVPEGTDWRVSAWFFGSISLANMCSVYVVVVGSCLVVLGNQLALLGQDGDSLERAVTHLRKRRFSLFFMGFISLFSMISGGMALAWIKMGVGKRTPPPRTLAHIDRQPAAALTVRSCALRDRSGEHCHRRLRFLRRVDPLVRPRDLLRPRRPAARHRFYQVLHTKRIL